PDSGGTFAGSFYDFDPSPAVDTRQRVTIGAFQTISLGLEWDNPFYTTSGVVTDLNYQLINSAGAVVAAGSTNNRANQTPFEFLSFTNVGLAAQFDLMIQLSAGPTPGRIKYVNFGANNYGPMIINEYATNSPTVVAHAAAVNAISVGAVPYFDH